MDSDRDIQIDDQNTEPTQEPSKYDWTQVKLPRRIWEKRPELNTTMDTQVTK